MPVNFTVKKIIIALVTYTKEQENNRLSQRTRDFSHRLTYRSNALINFPTTTTDEPVVKESINSTSQEADLWKKAFISELVMLEDQGIWSKAGNFL